MAEDTDKKLLDYSGKDQVLPFAVLAEKYKSSTTVGGFTTGFPKVDKHRGGGLAVGELYIV